MTEQVHLDINKVGYDNDFSGTDACCIVSLNGQKPTPEGVGLTCDVCGDAWVSEVKEDDGVVWFRTFAGKYPESVRAKIVIASKRERVIKRSIVLIIVALALLVAGWNVIEYLDEDFALNKILFNTIAIVLVVAVSSVFLFSSLFRKFSRNTKKLKYEIKSI